MMIRPMEAADADYLRDESRLAGHAEHIAFPETESELVHILRHAWHEGMPVTIQGARTGLAGGAVPKGGLVVSMMHMQQVLGMELVPSDADDSSAATADGQGGANDGGPGGFLLRVQPGLHLIQLRRMLRERRWDTGLFSDADKEIYQKFVAGPPQFFAPDPTETTASLGGMAACNASGARTFRYGPMRAHVDGLRVVLADGQRIALSRGQVRACGYHMQLTTLEGATIVLELPALQLPEGKNAAGYYIKPDMDAVDLFIGSDGTLGVISALTLKLTPLPPSIWGVFCFFPGETQVMHFVSAAKGELNDAAALEYFDENALNILREGSTNGHMLDGIPWISKRYRCAVYVELHNDSAQHGQNALRHLGELLDRCGGSRYDTWAARSESGRESLLFLRHAVPESVNTVIDARKKQTPTLTKLGADLAVPDAAFPALMHMYHETLADGGFQYAMWGHIGNNHLHVNILPRNETEYVNGKALQRNWAQQATALGGTVSAEHGVGKLKSDLLKVMYGESGIKKMVKLKQALDEKGLLGTGNMGL